MKTSRLAFGLVSVAACASSAQSSAVDRAELRSDSPSGVDRAELRSDSPSGPSSPASPPASATPSPPAADVLADEPTRAAFFATLSKNDDDAALALLAKTPALARAHTPRGTSAYFAALGRQVKNGFLRPQENRVAHAILALHPPLDGFDAAAAGDVDRVKQEIDADPGFLSRVHRLGWTPLHFAAFGGQPAVIELLVLRGAAVNAAAQNSFANTPLQVALLTRQGDAARALLAHGADVNFKQAEGVTALHEAAQSGDADVVRMLLAAGADPNARTGKLDDGKSGRTALDLARDAGHADVVALLTPLTRSGGGG